MITFRTLGSIALLDDDGAAVPGVLANPGRVALLAWLGDGAAPRLHRRTRLQALLWPDLEPEPAQRALRNALYVIRGALGRDAVVSEGQDEIRLNAERVHVDAAEFERRIAVGDAAGALGLYGGSWLPGFAPEGVSPEVHHWIDARREELRRSAVGVEEELLAGADGGAADAEQVAVWADTLLALAPTDERAAGLAMEALASVGSVARALEVFEAHVAALRRELDVVPAAETAALARRIRTEARTRSHPLGTRLALRPPPVPAARIVGRDAEVPELRSLLEGGDRLVTVTGTGGSGKTRLAQEVAQDPGSRFPDGVAWVELAPVGDAGGVPAAIARAVGVQEAATRSLEEGLEAVLADRRVLLVLDNFEHVVDAAPGVASLLAASPDLAVLVTSRAPLRIRGEVEFPLRPLALAPPGADARDVGRFPATRLFVAGARKVQPAFDLDEAGAGPVAEICRRLDGLPLALELASSRMRVFTPEALLRRLDRSLDVIGRSGRDVPERHRTLSATIDWSHSLLTGRQQALLRRLSVFRGGFDLEAVGPVCGEPGAEDPDVATDLEALLEAGLVDRPDGSDRFRLLETVRQYATGKAAAAGEQIGLADRHARYFAAFARDVDRGFRSADQVAAVAAADADEANLTAALQHLSGRRDEAWARAAGLETTGDLWFYWHVRGGHVSTRRWAEIFLQGDAPPRARALGLRAAGLASWTLGDFDRAARELDEAAQHGDGSPHLLPAIVSVRGVAHLSAGRLERARADLVEGVRLSRELGEPWELGLALALLGLMHAALGEADEGREALEEALRIQERNGDREGAGLSLGGLAVLADEHEAPALYDAAIEAFRDIGDRPEEARILDARAWVALQGGELGAARRDFAASLRAYEDVGSDRGVGLALLGLAATEAATDRPERALRLAGAAEARRLAGGMVNDYAEGRPVAAFLDPARAAIGEATARGLEREGRRLGVREVLALVAEGDV